MSDERPKRPARVADTALAVALFGIIATLNFLLFVESAGNVLLYRVIYGALSFVLDGTEITLWLRGVRQRNAVFMALALAIATVSLFSSTGAALLIATSDDAAVEATVAEGASYAEAVASAAETVTAWTDRLRLVPEGYTTQLRFVATELAKAEDALKIAKAEQRNAQATVATGDRVVVASPMFTLLSARLGMRPSSLKLLFLVIVSALLQASALIVTYHRERGDAEVKPKQKTETYVDNAGVRHVSNNGGGVLCGKPMRAMVAPIAGIRYALCDICAKKGGIS